MTAEALLWMIGRAALFTSASALAAAVLLSWTKIRTPRVHRVVWMTVVLQVWLLMPFVWQFEREAVAPSPNVVEAVFASPAAAGSGTVIVRPANELDELAPIQWPQLLVIVWLAGGAMAASSRAISYWRFVRQLPLTSSEVDAAWQADWARQLRAAGIRRNVELRATHDLGPLVCFARGRYFMLVPRALWESLDRRARRAILRHEIAHLVRNDLWWSLAIRLLALPQWFNPLVWLAVRRFDEAGEWACDDWVSRGRRESELRFARSLLAAAEFAATGSPGTASAQGGRLSRRVRRLISRQREDVMTKKLVVLIPLVAIVALQLVRIEFVAADEPPAATTDATTAQAPTKVSPPPQYVIEPPDVLMINAVKLVPKAPHRIEPFDSLLVRVLGALPDQPIADAFAVDAEGKIDLGPTYGRIEVEGLTLDEAKQAITQALEQLLQAPQVSVSLASSAGVQQITGEHLVAPDGRVNLGIYGTVFVSGLTIPEAREAIEQQLAEYLNDPRVTVDVASYNSKKYYVITRTAGRGDFVTAATLTGNDRVLDALSKIGDLPEDAASKIWISRPSVHGDGPDSILPVRWDEITSGKSTKTNYRLLPGDRLFVIGGQPEGQGRMHMEKLDAAPAKHSASSYGYSEPRNIKPTTLPYGSAEVQHVAPTGTYYGGSEFEGTRPPSDE